MGFLATILIYFIVLAVILILLLLCSKDEANDEKEEEQKPINNSEAKDRDANLQNSDKPHENSQESSTLADNINQTGENNETPILDAIKERNINLESIELPQEDTHDDNSLTQPEDKENSAHQRKYIEKTENLPQSSTSQNNGNSKANNQDDDQEIEEQNKSNDIIKLDNNIISNNSNNDNENNQKGSLVTSMKTENLSIHENGESNDNSLVSQESRHLVMQNQELSSSAEIHIPINQSTDTHEIQGQLHYSLNELSSNSSAFLEHTKVSTSDDGSQIIQKTQVMQNVQVYQKSEVKHAVVVKKEKKTDNDDDDDNDEDDE